MRTTLFERKDPAYERQRRINGDALTIAPRGDVYSLADTQLSLWPNIGVALHLHSGRRRFILGGRDRQIGPPTPWIYQTRDSET